METSISSFSRDDFHDYNSDPQTSPLNPLGFEDLLDDDELFLESDEDMFLEAETVSQNMRADWIMKIYEKMGKALRLANGKLQMEAWILRCPHLSTVKL